jgi:hypothetical protein
LLFDLFGLACFANQNKNCQLSYSRFETSQTGGQLFSDTSPFGIPWIDIDIRGKPVNPKLFCISFSAILEHEVVDQWSQHLDRDSLWTHWKLCFLSGSGEEIYLDWVGLGWVRFG